MHDPKGLLYVFQASCVVFHRISGPFNQLPDPILIQDE